MNALCKIFNFFLSIFDAVLNVIVQAANSLLNAALDVLDSAASSLLGSPLVVVLGLGLLAWWALSGSDESTTRQEVT